MPTSARTYQAFLVVALTVAVAACGGGGSSKHATSAPPSPSPSPSPTIDPATYDLNHQACASLGAELSLIGSQLKASLSALTISDTVTRMSATADKTVPGSDLYPESHKIAGDFSSLVADVTFQRPTDADTTALQGDLESMDELCSAVGVPGLKADFTSASSS